MLNVNCADYYKMHQSTLCFTLNITTIKLNITSMRPNMCLYSDRLTVMYFLHKRYLH